MTDKAFDTVTPYDFKGNFDLEKLEKTILEKGPDNIAMVIVTVTNNSAGGQPVSMDNIRKATEIAKKYDIFTVMDAARFAENAYFIKQREPGYENHSIKEIVLVNVFGYRCFYNECKKRWAR